MDVMGLRHGPDKGCSEHGNEFYDSVKGREFLDQQSAC
jgi:hypothetical protein